MTYRPASIVAPLAASLCLLVAGTTGASAQVQCWMPPSAGPPVVDDAHILCGVINAAGQARGFHSRFNGINPVHIPAVGAPPVQIIGNGAVGAAAAGAPMGIYRLNNFTITQNGVTNVKLYSTMFPDACTPASVLVAVRNAAAGAAAGGAFNGQNGPPPACQAGNPGGQFNITGFTNANGDILTGYPNY